MNAQSARAEGPGVLPQAALALLFALLATGAVIALFLASKQIVFAIAGALLLAVAFALSGNQRLFCLWGLMLTAPLGASKSLALVSPHMGGASAVTVDMCDFFMVPLLAFILRDRIRGWRRLRFSPVLFWWGALMLLGVIDILLGRYRTLAFLEIVRSLKCYLLAFIIINEVVRVRQFMHVFAALVIGIGLQAVFALIQYTFKANLGLQFLGEPALSTTESATASVYLGTADIFRAGGLFSHPNLLAGFMALLLPICIAMLFSRMRPIFKAAVGVVVGLGLMALVITLSRSGWLSFAAAFVVLFGFSMLHGKLRLRYVLARVLVIMALLGAFGLASGDIIRRFTNSDPGALQFRYDMMGSAWSMVVDHPVFGMGMNSFVAHFPEYSDPPGADAVTAKYGRNWPVVHNSYLVFWTQQGTVGFVCLMGLYFSTLWAGFRTARYLIDDLVFALNLGASCGIVAIMVDGIGSFFINESASERVFFMVVGLVFALHYWTRANLAARRQRAAAPSPELPSVSAPALA